MNSPTPPRPHTDRSSGDITRRSTTSGAAPSHPRIAECGVESGTMSTTPSSAAQIGTTASPWLPPLLSEAAQRSTHAAAGDMVPRTARGLAVPSLVVREDSPRGAAGFAAVLAASAAVRSPNAEAVRRKAASSLEMDAEWGDEALEASAAEPAIRGRVSESASNKESASDKESASAGRKEGASRISGGEDGACNGESVAGTSAASAESSAAGGYSSDDGSRCGDVSGGCFPLLRFSHHGGKNAAAATAAPKVLAPDRAAAASVTATGGVPPPARGGPSADLFRATRAGRARSHSDERSPRETSRISAYSRTSCFPFRHSPYPHSPFPHFPFRHSPFRHYSFQIRPWERTQLRTRPNSCHIPFPFPFPLPFPLPFPHPFPTHPSPSDLPPCASAFPFPPPIPPTQALPNHFPPPAPHPLPHPRLNQTLPPLPSPPPIPPPPPAIPPPSPASSPLTLPPVSPPSPHPSPPAFPPVPQDFPPLPPSEPLILLTILEGRGWGERGR
ncbi:unnamed protein product [Closterium sp. NIES-65]|nr:unnamed protein product [Closterium sp. NIES-65]